MGSALRLAYRAFDQLNGHHPWMEAVPEGYVAYPVRTVEHGRLLYFNYDLAKEMELIPKNHPPKMNEFLRTKILDTFCLQIINEYDRLKKRRFDLKTVKNHEYMATRYLQLQHRDKRGSTSGDGRSIWNGTIRTHHGSWDVSSRGTGVTRLAPGAANTQEPLETGNDEVSYGCGKAELDELFATVILSEIFHRQGIPTERTLVIIDLGKGYGIGVRAFPNLLRPAHLFLHLKQGNHAALQRAVDFFIERQIENHRWPRPLRNADCYDVLLNQITSGFANLAARLERDYIFNWFDWDGDNVLADVGLIDYGSIRQFGLRHDQYRYDDIERYSTNLNEQKGKAKNIVKTFVQLVDFLKTKKKNPLENFSEHPLLKNFESQFHLACLNRFLFQVGCIPSQIDYLLLHWRSAVEQLYNHYRFFENLKLRSKVTRVADGINKPALLNMRKAFIVMADFYLTNSKNSNTSLLTSNRLIFKQLLSDSGRRRRTVMNNDQNQRLTKLTKSYGKILDLLKKFDHKTDPTEVLSRLHNRATIINRVDRITGNAVTVIAEELLSAYKKGESVEDLQQLIDHLIHSQILDPDLRPRSLLRLTNQRTMALWEKCQEIIREFQEDI